MKQLNNFLRLMVRIFIPDSLLGTASLTLVSAIANFEAVYAG